MLTGTSHVQDSCGQTRNDVVYTPMTAGLRVRCSRGQAYNDDCVRVVTSQGGTSITVVGAGFTYDYKIALEVIEGNITAAKYRGDILRDVILPFLPASSPSRELHPCG